MSTEVTHVCQHCRAAFLCKGHAKYCPTCRPEVKRKRTTKYKITQPVKILLQERYNSLIRGRAGELARQLGWPRWAVTRVAQKLGLAHPCPKDRRTWTRKEESFLRKWAGRRSAKWIGRRIGRGMTSVTLKLGRLRLSRRLTEGYSERALEKVLGVDHRRIRRWSDSGWLICETPFGADRGDGQPAMMLFSEASVLRFLIDHRDEYELRRVDQEWFLWLIFDSQASRSILGGEYFRDDWSPDPSPEQIEHRKRAVRRAKGELVTA